MAGVSYKYTSFEIAKGHGRISRVHYYRTPNLPMEKR